MRHSLYLPLCTLLACAHTQPVAAPASSPVPAVQPAPADPESQLREALQRAGRAMEAGHFDSALSEMQRLWEGGRQTDEVAWFAAYASLGAGDDAAAFQWLERAVERGWARRATCCTTSPWSRCGGCRATTHWWRGRERTR
ncbi:hypothetical protein QEG98_35995 [Myxococcus sp. MxC21-1]|uniref:hypothetical protein n=1 Tax=Myxococcus sp. MxC21-1 TaxID=3041439 RepID=UPI002930AD5B|nr:hypothetical protein [Myxococcus sp. MxC21-1]WNZ61249.1 hypothetical protein QEG98_35995 [Myxococcus sp. MxC21-1]